MDPIIIGYLIFLGITNLASYFYGVRSERARTERKMAELRKQILALSNKSSKMENRYKKLLYACAIYELVLFEAAQSQNPEVRRLIFEFAPISDMLREGGSGWIVRLMIRFQVKSSKRKIKALMEDQAR